MIKKLATVAMAGLLALSVVGSAPQPAEAHRGGGIGFGIAAGILAGAALGSYYAYGYPRYYRYSHYYTYDDGCYQGPRRCRRVGGHCDVNRFGDTVCHGGVVRCSRPTICD